MRTKRDLPLKSRHFSRMEIGLPHVIRRVFFQSLAVVLEGIKIVDGWAWVRVGQVQFLVETKH